MKFRILRSENTIIKNEVMSKISKFYSHFSYVKHTYKFRDEGGLLDSSYMFTSHSALIR